MYEFVCGAVPFGEAAEDPMDVYVSIINDQIDYPKFCKDKEFKSLINAMLTKNTVNRTLKLAQVKSNIWFNDFDWEGLISMNIEAGYISKKEANKSENTNIPFLKYMEVNII
jgi:hypothetical protein